MKYSENVFNRVVENFPVVEVQYSTLKTMWTEFEFGNTSKTISVTIGTEKEEAEETIIMMTFLSTIVLLLVHLVWLTCFPRGSQSRHFAKQSATKLFLLKNKRLEKKRKEFYERTINSFQKAEVSDEVKAELKKIYISKKMLKVDSREIGAGYFGNVYKGHLRYQDRVIYSCKDAN